MRTCRDCKTTKPLTEFYRERKSKDGRRSVCKKCCNAKRLAWSRGMCVDRYDAPPPQPGIHERLKVFLSPGVSA